MMMCLFLLELVMGEEVVIALPVVVLLVVGELVLG
jgi:hypothetical protein